MSTTTSPGDLGGLIDEDGERCKFAVVDQAPFDSQQKYAGEYLRVCKIVASHPEGALLHQILSELHGRDDLEAGSTEYQRLRRFMSSHPEFFAVRKVNGLIRVAPQLDLLDLIHGGIIQNGPESGYTGGLEFCQDLLRTVDRINEKGEKLLEQNLADYVDRINDYRLILRSEVSEPEYITMPYKTRFNDEGRIDQQWAVMASCIEKAGEWFDNAALLTLTTDPKKFDSIAAMWDSINDSWNRFMSWLSSDSRLGYRPEYTKVLEATEKGYPHIHAIVYLEDGSTTASGMPWLEKKSEISKYWDKYQGRIVDVEPLTWVDDLPDEYGQDSGWVRWDKDGDHGGTLEQDGDEDDESGDGAQTAGQYLGKYLSAIYGGIKGMQGPQVMTDGGQVLEDDLGGKYEDKAAAWKIAMYWATGRKIRTDSRELRQAVEEEMEEREEEEEEQDRAVIGEIIARNYEFVGAYQDHEIPDHIRRNAVGLETITAEEDPDVPPGAGDDPPEKSRIEKMRRRYPSRVWPLLEGLQGGDPQ